MIDHQFRVLGVAIVGSAFCIVMVLVGLYAHSQEVQLWGALTVVCAAISLGAAYLTWLWQAEPEATTFETALRWVSLVSGVAASPLAAWSMFLL